MAAEVVDGIPLSKDANGVYRVGGTRVTLDLIIRAFNRGATAEEIAQDFPSLQLSDIYQVIGYYLKNKRCWERMKESGRLVAFGSGCWPGVRAGEVAHRRELP